MITFLKNGSLARNFRQEMVGARTSKDTVNQEIGTTNIMHNLSHNYTEFLYYYCIRSVPWSLLAIIIDLSILLQMNCDVKTSDVKTMKLVGKTVLTIMKEEAFASKETC